MAINTLLDYANEELNTLTAARTDATAALNTQTQKVRDAATTLADLNGELRKELDAGVGIRRALAAKPSAAEAEVLTGKLLDHEIAMTALNAEMVDAQRVEREESARAESAAQQLARASAAATAAAAQQKAEEKEDVRRKALKKSAQDLAALSPSFETAAKDVRNGTDSDYAKAKARVETEVPPKLREAARQRALARETALGAAATTEGTAATAATDKHVLHGGASAKVLAPRLALAAAEERLRRVVIAPDTLAGAIAQLKAIHTAPPLSAEAQQRIDDLTAAGEQALTDLPAKKAAAEAAGATPAEVGEYEEALETIELYTSAVPEEAWLRLFTFDELTRRFDGELIKYTPAEITDARIDYEDAEKALATALRAEADAMREVADADHTLALRRREAAIARESRQMTLVAAMRVHA